MGQTTQTDTSLVMAGNSNKENGTIIIDSAVASGFATAEPTPAATRWPSSALGSLLDVSLSDPSFSPIKIDDPDAELTKISATPNAMLEVIPEEPEDRIRTQFERLANHINFQYFITLIMQSKRYLYLAPDHPDRMTFEKNLLKASYRLFQAINSTIITNYENALTNLYYHICLLHPDFFTFLSQNTYVVSFLNTLTNRLQKRCEHDHAFVNEVFGSFIEEEKISSFLADCDHSLEQYAAAHDIFPVIDARQHVLAAIVAAETAAAQQNGIALETQVAQNTMAILEIINNSSLTVLANICRELQWLDGENSSEDISAITRLPIPNSFDSDQLRTMRDILTELPMITSHEKWLDLLNNFGFDMPRAIASLSTIKQENSQRAAADGFVASQLQRNRFSSDGQYALMKENLLPVKIAFQNDLLMRGTFGLFTVNSTLLTQYGFSVIEGREFSQLAELRAIANNEGRTLLEILQGLCLSQLLIANADETFSLSPQLLESYRYADITLKPMHNLSELANQHPHLFLEISHYLLIAFRPQNHERRASLMLVSEAAENTVVDPLTVIENQFGLNNFTSTQHTGSNAESIFFKFLDQSYVVKQVLQRSDLAYLTAAQIATIVKAPISNLTRARHALTNPALDLSTTFKRTGPAIKFMAELGTELLGHCEPLKRCLDREIAIFESPVPRGVTAFSIAEPTVAALRFRTDHERLNFLLTQRQLIGGCEERRTAGQAQRDANYRCYLKVVIKPMLMDLVPNPTRQDALLAQIVQQIQQKQITNVGQIYTQILAHSSVHVIPPALASTSANPLLRSPTRTNNRVIIDKRGLWFKETALDAMAHCKALRIICENILGKLLKADHPHLDIKTLFTDYDYYHENLFAILDDTDPKLSLESLAKKRCARSLLHWYYELHQLTTDNTKSALVKLTAPKTESTLVTDTFNKRFDEQQEIQLTNYIVRAQGCIAQLNTLRPTLTATLTQLARADARAQLQKDQPRTVSATTTATTKNIIEEFFDSIRDFFARIKFTLQLRSGIANSATKLAPTARAISYHWGREAKVYNRNLRACQQTYSATINNHARTVISPQLIPT